MTREALRCGRTMLLLVMHLPVLRRNAAGRLLVRARGRRSMRVHRVTVRPALQRRVRERARSRLHNVSGRCPRMKAWKRGGMQPRRRPTEGVAKSTHAPSGSLFLAESWGETVPMPTQVHFGARIVIRHGVSSISVRETNGTGTCIGLGANCMAPFQVIWREQARSLLGVPYESTHR